MIIALNLHMVCIVNCKVSGNISVTYFKNNFSMLPLGMYMHVY